MTDWRWLPIETVPEEIKCDGTLLLLFKPDERRSGESIFVGYWSDRENDWMPVYGIYPVKNVTKWMLAPVAPRGSDG